MAKTVKPMTISTRRGGRREVLVGMGDVLDRLTDLAQAAGDCSPAWDELGDMWAARQNAVFDSNGGGKWTGFAVETILEHESPLVDEGVMREGMTSARPRFSDKHMVAFGPPKGDRRVQGIATLNTVGHADRGGGQVPKRAVVPPLSASERRRWIEVIDRHIKDAVD